jgi:methyl-accepting chemotaxis protein
MFKFISKKIRNKIIALPVTIVLLLSFMMLIYFPSNKRKELLLVTAQQVTATSDLLAFGLGVALDSDRFDAINEGYSLAKKMGAVSYIALFDNKNVFLSAYNPDSIKIENSRASFNLDKAIEKNGYFEKAASIRFKDNVYGTVIVGVSLNSVRKASLQSFILLGVISLLTIIISIVISIFFSARIVAPLQAVRSAMQLLSRKDLTKRCNVSTVDETADMAKDVNGAIDSLNSSISTVSKKAEQISKATVLLSTLSSQIASNAEDMANRSQTVSQIVDSATHKTSVVSKAAEGMSDTVGSVAAAIEQMSASLHDVAQHCIKESQIATEANKEALNTQAQIEKLNTSADEIGQITSVINDIAAQTNLLALNATIEAARSGEAGRGFAVVANEVKDLAHKTAEATSEIGIKIRQMQDDTKGAVNAVKIITDIVDQVNTISQTIVLAVEQQSTAIQELASTSNSVSSSTSEISLNVKDLASGMSTISGDITNVNSAAQMTAQDVEKTKISISELVQLASDLKEVVKTFSI